MEELRGREVATGNVKLGCRGFEVSRGSGAWLLATLQQSLLGCCIGAMPLVLVVVSCKRSFRR